MDPVLEGILSDLNRVTDFSQLIKLQKTAKSSEPEEDEKADEDMPVQHVVNKASNSAVKAVEEMEDPDVAVKELTKAKKSLASEEEDDEEKSTSG